MTCKVRRDFKIITDELSHVSRQFHWWHRTFGIFDLFPKISIEENKSGDFGRVEGSFQNRRVKGSEAPTCPTQLLRPICQACVNSQLSPSPPPTPPRGREKKNVTKMNFSSCSDHSPKGMINDCYIFFPYLRVWVFLFLRTSFFKAQTVGLMLHSD